jgi:50S ribosomal subunit-associated GTPase HflX
MRNPSRAQRATESPTKLGQNRLRSRLVKTLGYEVVGAISQKRDAIDGGTVLGKGRLA